MPDSTTRVNALVFRFTPDLAGGVWYRRLPPEFGKAWRAFDNAYRARSGRDVQPAHTAVSLALRGLLGGHAHFDPARGELVTEKELDEQDLLDVVTLFHAFALDEEPDLSRPCELAEIAASAPVERLYIGDYLDGGPTQPCPPGWVFETAVWAFTRALAQQPWQVDGRTVQLRDDTGGALNAWNDLWLGHVRRPSAAGAGIQTQARYAMARIAARLKTLPNVAHPVLLLDGTATRISPTLRGVSSVLVEQKAADAPLVRLALDGRIARHVNRAAAQTLAALSVDRAVLDLDDFTADGAKPGRVRGIVPKSWRFAIGRGVGMHFHRELYRHVHEVFPQIRTVGTRAVRGRLPAPRRERIEASAIADSLRAYGHTSLTVVCLWAKDVNRRRMLTELGDALGTDLTGRDPVDGETIVLSNAIRVAVKHAPELLAHGTTVDRAAFAALIPALRPEPGGLVAVLCETDSQRGVDHGATAAEPPTEAEARAAYRRYLERRRQNEAEDAKPQVRRLLARRGLVCQFLDHPKPTRRSVKPPKHEDYPVRAAVIDLFRSAGLADDRFTHALSGVTVGEHPATALAHVGIHVRQQNKQTRSGKTKLVVTMTALVPPAMGETSWTLRGWAHRDRARWEPYPAACASFHAVTLEVGSRNHDDLVKIADIVEFALGTLTDTTLRGIPYILYTDGFTSRGVWPGLFNSRQSTTPSADRPWLPGATLPTAQRPLVVVRVNAETAETPRPVSAMTIKIDGDGRQNVTEWRTATKLFRVETDFGSPVFWLSRVPAQFDGAGSGRLGENVTRWTVDEGPAVRRTWYSMNTLEVYPIADLPDADLEAVAGATARLCRQTSGWDGQTTYPEPLHLARQMDLDHPEYRSAELPDDPEPALLAHDE